MDLDPGAGCQPMDVDVEGEAPRPSVPVTAQPRPALAAAALQPAPALGSLPAAGTWLWLVALPTSSAARSYALVLGPASLGVYVLCLGHGRPPAPQWHDCTLASLHELAAVHVPASRVPRPTRDRFGAFFQHLASCPMHGPHAVPFLPVLSAWTPAEWLAAGVAPPSCTPHAPPLADGPPAPRHGSRQRHRERGTVARNETKRYETKRPRPRLNGRRTVNRQRRGRASC